MFRVSILETDEDDSILDAYTDDMDFIGISRILDVAHASPILFLTYLEFSYLMMSQSLMSLLLIFTSVEGVSDSMDPPLSSDTMSRFVTHFDDISDDNNDMSIFEYLTVPQHFPLIAPPAPTTHIYDVDDVGDADDPLDQPKEIRIGSSLSPDERSRLIDLLRPVKQKLRRLHPRWSLQVKEEIRKQLSVAFLSVVEYPEWLAHVIPVPKKDGKGTYCYRVMPYGLKNAGATYQRVATTLFHDMMHTDVETVQAEIESKKCTFGVASRKLLGHIVSERGIEIDPEKIRAILDMPAPRTEK
ncbi:hypothetical protein CK203_110477 [Vitis vinifera]|uniref:Uncharacterized protein n=1 Tax=Vitis vinifera TaxID=29760 RepID=A0A438CE23_VITVI|nr:hypothetical protein CK203_110477 [Vitis vinifera]